MDHALIRPRCGSGLRCGPATRRGPPPHGGLIALILLLAATAGAPCREARADGPAVIAGLRYAPPDVAVVTGEGRPARFPALLEADRAVIVDFVFTSCQAICPVMSTTFAQLERKLGADRGRVRLVSVSIDPETDTPAVLHAYATRFHAGPDWTFVTGSRDSIAAIQKGFQNFQRNKMEHVAVYFLRPAHESEWVRIEGLATASDLYAEYERTKRR